ncbi:hypothetical protein [Lacticaseibacillus jixiensis]|uniref:hypothetical protein n=1 Tax=Lacticaseibacillus jixiensis TaxID=3231926 RepID=UPI0036F3D068
MKRIKGSALLYALIVLGLVTMGSVLTLQQYAQWRAGYVREIRTQETLMQARYARWLDESSD